VLVAIIFLWTPPHFWALSLWRSEDYARAGVPMLPVVRGKRATRLQILLYSLVLLPAGVLPAFVGTGGPLYLVVAALSGLALAVQSVFVFFERDEVREPAAHRLFGISLVYVFALFASLMVERALHIAPLGVWM
jgi:protoheme IX farnesyltransferase